MKAWLPHILFVLGILACCAVSYFVGYGKGFEQAPVVEKRDTFFRRETLTVYEPKEIIKYRDKLVFVPAIDTIQVHDTTYVALQGEKKVYQGKDYRAVVSGVFPRLEEISVFPKTVTITNTRTIRKRWGFNVTAGPGIVWNGQFHPGVGVVVGFGYSF